MKTSCVATAFVLTMGVVLSAQGTSASQTRAQGPDLSGRWTRESVSGNTDRADSDGWGSRVDIEQSGGRATVKTESGKPERYRLDGTETAEVVSVEGCANQTRITKAQTGPDRVTITTWLVTKGGCFHGEFADEPLVYQTGPVEVRNVLGGPRKLESITVVFREGDTMIIDTTRANPGGEPVATTTTYRK